MTRIAIVDDSSLFRQGFILLLKQLRYTVSIESEHGKEFIERLGQSLPPDLIFLDTQLHDIDSFAVLKWIKTNCPAVPIIILHGKSDLHLLWQLLRGGAYTHLSKTANISVVKRAIEEALFNSLPEKIE